MQRPEPPDRGRAAAGARHLSLRAGQACPDWVRRFIPFRRKRHPERAWRGRYDFSAPTPRPGAGLSLYAECGVVRPRPFRRGAPQVSPPHAEAVWRAPGGLTGAYALVAAATTCGRSRGCRGALTCGRQGATRARRTRAGGASGASRKETGNGEGLWSFCRRGLSVRPRRSPPYDGPHLYI